MRNGWVLGTKPWPFTCLFAFAALLLESLNDVLDVGVALLHLVHELLVAVLLDVRSAETHSNHGTDEEPTGHLGKD